MRVFIHSSVSRGTKTQRNYSFCFVSEDNCSSVKMFMSYEVMATFGISAILSFTVSAIVLLIIAAKKGLLRVGSQRKTTMGQCAQNQAMIQNKGQIGSPLLVTPSAPPMAMVLELAPLKEYA